jgi:anaerobic ribonucleoside-triphosphate reductase activating protein
MALPINVCGIEPESIVDGPGFRYVVFVQGCPHHCPGCHNPQSHPFEGGTPRTAEELFAEFRENPLLAGITLSGGEPFCQATALCALAQMVKDAGKTVIAYSGYTLEQLLQKSEKEPDILRLLKLTDTLIDGPYVESKRNLELLFRGSENQRIIDLNDWFAAHPQ